MLKRTITVLAVLAMVAALMPAAALAGAADITEVEIVVNDGTTAVVGATVDATVGGLTVWGAPVATGAGGSTGFVPTVKADYDGDLNTATDFPQAGNALAISVTMVGGEVYYFNAVLTDGDADGKSKITVSVPKVGTGTITGLNDIDLDSTATDLGTPWPGMISVYKNGVLFASTAATPAGYTILTGPGAFTVSSDITGTGVVVFSTTPALDTDLDTGEGTPPVGAGNPDEGEIMFFSKKGTMTGATTVNVGAGITVTGVNFQFENEATNLNPLTFDHTDTGSFTDMVGHWAEASASAAAGLALVQGCTTTSFCPEADITRAEFAAILGREITGNVIPVVVANVYPDVTPAHWAAGWIKALKTAGVVTGDAAGNFNPDAPITRAEASVMLARWAMTTTGAGPFIAVVTDGPDVGATCSTADLPGATLSFIDVPTTHWAAKEVSWEFINGVVKGNADGTFGPDTNISRAEMVSLVMRAYVLPGGCV